MDRLPLVTIITPSYNQGQFLEETIRSVLDQDYARIEYMVFDGASTDDSGDILSRYAERLTYWESVPDRGQAHAINKGLQRAEGEILGWLNADDLLIPETVSRAVRIFSSHPRVDVVYGRLKRIDATGIRVPTPDLPKDEITFSKASVIGESVVNQPGSFWRRPLMDQVGLLDESLQYCLDYEYWIRMALAGAEFLRLSETVAYFRLSADSKTVSQATAMAEEQLTVLEQVLQTPNLSNQLGLSDSQIKQQAQKTRAALQLHAFYGEFRKRNWKTAAHWLRRAMQNDPQVIFQKRWYSLAAAGLARRLNAF